MSDGPLPTRTVLHVITDLDVGGAERMLANYATTPRNDGVRMVVASVVHPGQMAEPLAKVGIPVHDLGIEAQGTARLAKLPIALFRLTRLIRTLQPEAVVGWMYHANLMSLYAARLSGLRDQMRLYAGIRCSGMALANYPPMFRRVVEASRRTANAFDAVIYNSKAGQREHEAIGFKPRRTLVAQNGIDTDRFRPNFEARKKIRAELGIPDSTRVAVTAARVDPMKNYPLYMSALETASNPPTVMLAGLGTDDDSQIPPAPNRYRLGVRTDMPDVLAAADFIVMPSAYGEGFPNALAEGMAAGLVPIATPIGDAADIAGNCGWMVDDPRNVTALSNALDAAMSLSDDELNMRKASARARIENEFSLGAACARMDTAFGLGAS